MANKAKTDLHAVSSLITGSNTLKTANAYKKRLAAKDGWQKKWLRLLAINAACLLVAAVPLTLVLSRSAPQSRNALAQGEQTSAQASAAGTTPAGIPAGNPAAGSAAFTTQPQQAPAEDPLLEMEAAVEQMLASGHLSDLSSEDIQPKTSSDFLPVLQQRLMDLRYMEQDEPSTYYGIVTETAIEEFQLQHGLSATGIATYQTLLLLFSDNAHGKLISLGEEGPHVANIQERLLELGYDAKVTGSYGEVTTEAVRAFQLQNGFPESGSLNAEMEEALFSSDALCADGTPCAGEERAPQTLNVEALVDIAYEQLGAKYVRGGRSPGSFDCSGLVYYCLQKAGYDMRFLTSAGWRGSRFEKIEKMEDLQIGDICTFDGHVGIYIGYGKMIDASSSEGRVRISSNLTENRYWVSNWDGARRLVPAQEEV